ncbi:MAG: leucine--tRNA ligase [Acholeplasmatales bacterium]|jgi:leucyl-tRNA synthetase|nr:leucine--tRNA ligase [Acholeplasmatales bacterium]
MKYDFLAIEKKWQSHWNSLSMFSTLKDDSLKKYYVLDMFPYPSGAGLHVGHIEGYTATDIISRFKRMKGFNVLHPMGWDSFGLPAEQYALKTGNDPKTFTYKNIAIFKEQLIRSGKGIDWNREFATSDSEYYRWTQWIFKKLYENNLAVLKNVEVNWCEGLGTVLANDEILLVDKKMVSENGLYPVVKKPMLQWVLKITSYAERLLNDLDKLDWPESLKDMQRNWIGKSVGARIFFQVEDLSEKIEVFTTRPDTIFGATFLVLSPEHESLGLITTDDEAESVLNYIRESKSKTDFDRMVSKEKTGVFTGSFGINPVNQKRIPIFVADYVLNGYGTGAIMAVPAHDDRDYEFAKKFGLEVIKVIDTEELLFTGDGIHINSSFINKLNNKEASEKVIEYLIKYGHGSSSITYKMKDWVFSRQRYWGEPFPVIFGSNNEIILIDDKDLPLELPVMKNIKPSGTGESPLANVTDWINVNYKGTKGKRDSNTMPQLAGSSWYFLGYVLKNTFGMIPLDSSEGFSELNKWLPVDIYVGGTEHAVGHLLYSRFFTKFLFDLGIINFDEPFKKLVNQGIILGPDHQKMSKSKGNVINPDDCIKEYGADALRLHEMFLGPLESMKPWSDEGIIAAKKFIDRVVRISELEIFESEIIELRESYHQTIKKVEEDYENLSFNTAIAQMMIFVNNVYKANKISKEYYLGFLKLLNPICPHITEEINSTFLNNREEIIYSEWPKYVLEYTKPLKIEVAVQVNGKIRAKLLVDQEISKEELQRLAFENENVIKFIEGTDIKNIIIIPKKIVNIVVKEKI